MAIGQLLHLGASPSRAIADAGGVHGLMAALAGPRSPAGKTQIAIALANLALNGEAAAVAAADPSNATAATLQWLPTSPHFVDGPQARARVTQKL